MTGFAVILAAAVQTSVFCVSFSMRMWIAIVAITVLVAFIMVATATHLCAIVPDVGWSLYTAGLAFGLGLAFFSDLDSYTIPDVAILWLVACGITMLIWSAGPLLLHVAMCLALFSCVMLVSRFRPNMIGAGDIGLLAAVAVWLGPYGTAWALLLASVPVAFVIAIRNTILKEREHSRNDLPFAPYLATSAFSVWCFA